MATTYPSSATVPLDDMGLDPEARVPSESDYNLDAIPELDLDDKTREEMELWIREEIDLAKTERQELYERYELIQQLYEMYELEDHDYPFPDSSHLVIQLIATFVETVWAKEVNTIFSPADPMSAKPLRQEFTEFAKALRKFMTWAIKEELNLEESYSTSQLEKVKLGNCVVKIVYTIEDRTMFLYDPTTRKYTKTNKRLKDHPEVVHIPWTDFFYRQTAKNQDECVWKAHRILLTYGDILRKQATGELDEKMVDKFIILWQQGKAKKYDGSKRKIEDAKAANNVVNETPYESARNEQIGVHPRSNDQFEFYEIWYEYLVPKVDKLPIKLVGMFEPSTGLLFRVRHNWYPLQLDPFEIDGYIPREHKIPAIGVGEMAMAYQNEITAMHNQRIDNATIANASVTFIKEDSTMPLNFKVQPGGTYGVPDPNEVNVVSLGQKYDSTIQDEQHSLNMVQQRVGMQDFVQQQYGNQATPAILNMQEQTRKFDIIIRNTRRFLSRVMEKCLLLYQQHYPDGKPIMVLGAEGELVEELFKFPQNTIRYGIAVQVTATSSSTAKELERQTKLSLFNMMTQYYGQLTQYVLQSQNPQMPPMVQQTLRLIVDALGSLVRDVLDDFDQPNTDKLVIDGSDLGGIPPPQQSGPGGQAPLVQSGQTNGQGTAPAARMAPLQ